MWAPYVPKATRLREAAKAAEKARKAGQSMSPVRVTGRNIATTFWGQSWCQNLERYSDYQNRLPRGRTYVRNGSVVHLEVTSGEIRAKVMGSSMYTVKVRIEHLPARRWKALVDACVGQIDSLVDLLQGRFAKGVMERVCAQDTGLFPSPSEIDLSCSCPDWATMCKHVAAVLYGVGARLDEKPELLFALRKVDHFELVGRAAAASATGALTGKGRRTERELDEASMGDIFGIELDGEVPHATAAAKKPATRRARPKKATAKAPAAVATPFPPLNP